MCNHNENLEHTYLEIIDHDIYEVYVCECGALINIRDPKNYSDPVHPMNADEIAAMLRVVTPINVVARLREIADRKTEIWAEDERGGEGLLVRSDELAMEYQRITREKQAILHDLIGPNWWRL